MAITTRGATNTFFFVSPIEGLLVLPLPAGSALLHESLFKVYLRPTVAILKSESLIPSPYMAVRMASDPVFR